MFLLSSEPLLTAPCPCPSQKGCVCVWWGESGTWMKIDPVEMWQQPREGPGLWEVSLTLCVEIGHKYERMASGTLPRSGKEASGEVTAGAA